MKKLAQAKKSTYRMRLSAARNRTLNSTIAVKLYHFTNLMNLPAILREGILRGEVPVTPDTSIAQLNAPNLTANPNPADQRCWCRGATNKTKIRLTVEIPSDKLTSLRQVQAGIQDEELMGEGS